QPDAAIASRDRLDSDPEERAVDEGAADVTISASARAGELRSGVPMTTRVTFHGKGSIVTRRLGVPPTGAEPGVTYRAVDISTNIEARVPDQPARTRAVPERADRR